MPTAPDILDALGSLSLGGPAAPLAAHLADLCRVVIAMQAAIVTEADYQAENARLIGEATELRATDAAIRSAVDAFAGVPTVQAVKEYVGEVHDRCVAAEAKLATAEADRDAAIDGRKRALATAGDAVGRFGRAVEAGVALMKQCKVAEATIATLSAQVAALEADNDSLMEEGNRLRAEESRLLNEAERARLPKAPGALPGVDRAEELIAAYVDAFAESDHGYDKWSEASQARRDHAVATMRTALSRLAPPPVTAPPAVATLTEDAVFDAFTAAFGILRDDRGRDRAACHVFYTALTASGPVAITPAPGRTVTVTEVVRSLAGCDAWSEREEAIRSHIGSTITASAAPTPPTKAPPPKVEPGVPGVPGMKWNGRDAVQADGGIDLFYGHASDEGRWMLRVSGEAVAPDAARSIVEALHARLQGPATPRADEGPTDREALAAALYAAWSATCVDACPWSLRTADGKADWLRAADSAIARLAPSSGPSVEGPVWSGDGTATIGMLHLSAQEARPGACWWSVGYSRDPLHGILSLRSGAAPDLATARHAAVAFALGLNGADVRGPVVDVEALRWARKVIRNGAEWKPDADRQRTIAALDSLIASATPAKPAPLTDEAQADREAAGQAVIAIMSHVGVGGRIGDWAVLAQRVIDAIDALGGEPAPVEDATRERLRDAVIAEAVTMYSKSLADADCKHPLLVAVRAYNAHLTGTAKRARIDAVNADIVAGRVTVPRGETTAPAAAATGPRFVYVTAEQAAKLPPSTRFAPAVTREGVEESNRGEHRGGESWAWGTVAADGTCPGMVDARSIAATPQPSTAPGEADPANGWVVELQVYNAGERDVGIVRDRADLGRLVDREGGVKVYELGPEVTVTVERSEVVTVTPVVKS